MCLRIPLACASCGDVLVWVATHPSVGVGVDICCFPLTLAYHDYPPPAFPMQCVTPTLRPISSDRCGSQLIASYRHTVNVPSRDAVAINRFVGHDATLLTASLCPRRIHCGSFVTTSHVRTVPSSDPAKIHEVSCMGCTLKTQP